MNLLSIQKRGKLDMINNFFIGVLVSMNVLLLLVVFYTALGVKDKASKIGFSIMIFVFVANVITLIGGII